MPSVERLLKVWAAAALNALGGAVIFLAFRTPGAIEAALLFMVGLFVILSAFPLVPWLSAQPWFFAKRYWDAK